MVRWALVAMVLLFLSCTTTRKISQVGLRDLASVREEGEVSPLRAEILAASSLSSSCPEPIRKHLVALSKERVEFPSCPESLAERVQLALPFLKLEERSTVEEVLSSHCRSLGSTEFGDSLETFVANFDTTGPIGRRSKIIHTIVSQEHETKILTALKEGLQEIVDYHLPLDRWVRRNGDFLLPEEELTMLHRLVLKNSCRMTEQDMEQGYSAIRSLEELTNILRDGKQREKVEEFLSGLNLVIEQKLKEFFYP